MEYELYNRTLEAEATSIEPVGGWMKKKIYKGWIANHWKIDEIMGWLETGVGKTLIIGKGLYKKCPRRNRYKHIKVTIELEEL